LTPSQGIVPTLTAQCLTVVYFISSSSTTPGLQSALKDKWRSGTSPSELADDLGLEIPSKLQDGLQNADQIVEVPAPKPQPPKQAPTVDSVGTKPSDKDKTLGTTPNDGNTLGPAKAPGPRMNATFVTLARNSDIWEISKSIRHVEDRFNRKYHYDWVFLNEKPFDDEFKRIVSALVSGTARFGLIGEEHWSFPEWIDQDKAAAVRKDMSERKIIYGDSISYRHMCRFESGFFFRQPLMLEYEWYWRVEPSIDLYCDIDYDPFKFMQDNKKKYSFVLSLFEYKETIPTLWESTQKFMNEHPEHISKGNSIDWLSDDGGKTYNNCHFVS